MTHQRIIVLFMFIVGGLLILGGVGGFYSLYKASQTYERTTGVVLKLRTKRVYRHRKYVYDTDMLVRYPTVRYGEVSASTKSYNPFRREGDGFLLWYNPDAPRDIRLPFSDCVLWGFLVASGAICVFGGVLMRRFYSTGSNGRTASFR